MRKKIEPSLPGWACDEAQEGDGISCQRCLVYNIAHEPDCCIEHCSGCQVECADKPANRVYQANRIIEEPPMPDDPAHLVEKQEKRERQL